MVYFFRVGVEEDGELEEPAALLDAPSEARDVGLELVGHGVDVVGVALARLSELGSGREQLLRIGVRVLKGENIGLMKQNYRLFMHTQF